MKKVLLFSILLVLGMIGSQLLTGLTGVAYPLVREAIEMLTMVALASIMIHVGYEFDLDKSNLRQYGWDYVVAMTAAAIPWIFASTYFVFVMLPPNVWAEGQAWSESLLAGRFAAPTSAGVLFAMLAAAGLSATWAFRKLRILAIFDDLDTILLMIPLKMLVVGAAWHLGLVAVVMLVLLWLAWQYLHCWKIPSNWAWVMGYSIVIALGSELIYVASKFAHLVAIHFEVLLPAFVLGCLMKQPATESDEFNREAHHERPESRLEQRASTIVSAAFMLLVGLSMPQMFGKIDAATSVSTAVTITASQPVSDWWTIATHVLVLTAVINLGKMFPILCYRREAHWRERLVVAIGLWPRGEVGAGVLVVSLSYGIGGPIVTVAMLCLALNLLLTGLFIVAVKQLTEESGSSLESVGPGPSATAEIV
jgi:Kef-type K+ transport system membrane component KefB